MVLYELWDNTTHSNTHRETIKITEAKHLLEYIKSRSWLNVTNVQVFNPCTDNQVAIRTDGKCDVFMKFTYKQYMKILPLLVEVNNGEPVEKRWY